MIARNLLKITSFGQKPIIESRWSLSKISKLLILYEHK